MDCAAALLVFGVATLPFLWVLELPFTGIDALPTLTAVHVDGWRDWLALLNTELRGEQAEGVPYYRPVTLLTHAVDRALWGWNAKGHQASDLLLHGLMAVGVWAVARRAFDRGRGEALAAALLFVLHPVTIETVPAIARRPEVLMGLGACLMLLGARRLPAPRGGFLALAGVALGAASVERGLVLPAVLAAYLLFWRLRDEPWRRRLRAALAWTAPSALLVVAFYWIRLLLVGGGALRFALYNFVWIPPRFARWLLYPQQTVDLHAPGSPGEALVAGALAVAVAGVVGWALLRPQRRGLHLAAASWIVAMAIPPTIGGQMNSWYPYTAAAPLALLVASLMAQGLEAWPRRREAAAGALAAAYALLAVIVPSPVLRDYPAWRIAGAYAAVLDRDVLVIARDAPADTLPVLINVPSHVIESEGDFGITRSAAVHWPYSLQAWLHENGLRRPVAVLGSSLQVGELAVPRAHLSAPDRLAVEFPAGAAARYVDTSRPRRPGEPTPTGHAFAWPPAEAGERRPVAWMFVGDGFEPVPLP